MAQSAKDMVRKQKTYSLPLAVAEWLHNRFEENREDLALIGITTETKLLEVLARNGEQFVLELLRDLREKRKAAPISPRK